MKTFENVRSEILVPDEGVRAKVARRLDGKTKPRRSLGRLEDLASSIAAIQRTEHPSVRRKAIVVMAGDHGVSAQGVSAFPQEVTVQMLQNFAAGGAAICVLARHAGAEVVIVDMGSATAWRGHPVVLDRRVGRGTLDFTQGPAMTRDETLKAINVGIALAEELADREVSLIGLGEMGIANTTSASAMAAAFLELSPEEVTGRGTGVDDAGYRRKVDAIRKGLQVNRPNPADALDVLTKVGGFEIAGLVGLTLGAAARRVPVVTDGLIATAAALAASRLAPAVRGYLIPSHGSVEIGHRRQLEALGLRPLLDLEMRLGEGTGAALAMHLADASIRILDEMATFESAGVSEG